MNPDVMALAREWYAAALTADLKTDAILAMVTRWRAEYGDENVRRIQVATKALWAIDRLNDGDITQLEAKGFTVAQVERMKADAEASARQTH